MRGEPVYSSRVPAKSFAPGQVVTVFRNRLRADHEADYRDHAAEIAALARTMPGLVDFKTFTADDGERVTVVTFTDEATQAAWRMQADHVAAQRRGRADYYGEYSLQVCSTVRVSSYESPAGVAGGPAPAP